MHEKPKVSIVMPAYNCAATIEETIRACLGQDYPRDKLEIIVVDDGSTDNTRSIAEKLPIFYMHQKNMGPAAARNKGWRSAKGDVIFFIDADCIPARDCLSRSCESLYTKDVVAVAGSYGIKNEKDILAKAIHEEIVFRHSRMPVYINSFGTYNVLIKKDILEEMSGFNEDYATSSAEDSDLSYRIIKRGYKIYFEKRSIVFHYHEKNFYKYFKRQFIRSFWAMRLFKNHPDFVVKDYYAHWKDFIEAPLAIVVMLLFFFLRVVFLKAAFITFLLIYVLIEAIIPAKIYFKTQGIKLFFILFLVMFIRGFIRIFGGALGLVR